MAKLDVNPDFRDLLRRPTPMTARSAVSPKEPVCLEVAVGRAKPVRVGFSEPGVGGVLAGYRTGDRRPPRLDLSLSASAGNWGLTWLEKALVAGQGFTVSVIRTKHIDSPTSRRRYSPEGPRTVEVIKGELESARRNLSISQQQLRSYQRNPIRWELPGQVRLPRPAPITLHVRLNAERPHQVGVIGRGSVTMLVQLENSAGHPRQSVRFTLFGTHGADRVRWVDNLQLHVGDKIRVKVQSVRPLTPWSNRPPLDMRETLRRQVRAVHQRIKRLQAELASARRKRAT